MLAILLLLREWTRGHVVFVLDRGPSGLGSLLTSQVTLLTRVGRGLAPIYELTPSHRKGVVEILWSLNAAQSDTEG